MTLNDYLLARLQEIGVDHLFGIPGDYILSLFQSLDASEVQHIATCNELNGAYAADGYARLRGAGAIAVTYGPGAFSTVNAIAGALAERVPVIVISGGPPRDAYDEQPHMHHILPRRYDASLRIFEQVTAAARLIRDPATATRDIDNTLRIAITQRRPVYLEIASDLQTMACDRPVAALAPGDPVGDAVAAERAVAAIAAKLAGSRRSVMLAGHELESFGLQEDVKALAVSSGIPVASLFSGKANYLEHLDQCIGCYQGAGSEPVVRDFVEAADVLLFLGAVPSDFNLGGGSAQLRDGALIEVFDDGVEVDGERFAPVGVADVVQGLLEEIPDGSCAVSDAPSGEFYHRPDSDYVADADAAITNRRLYDRLTHFIRGGDVVLGDAGCLIAAAQIQLPPDCHYIGAGYWASIGMGFGATVGAAFAAADGARVIALEGDGSFQMTAQEISTLVRYDRRVIIVLVNNKGYTAERLIHDGPFNDIQDWRYHRLPEPFGGVVGEDVRTEGDLERALQRAENHAGPGPLMIEVHLDPFDVSVAFKRMSEGLRRK